MEQTTRLDRLGRRPSWAGKAGLSPRVVASQPIPWVRSSGGSALKKLSGPLRRALIYGLVSYSGLVLLNNSELNLPNMWVVYLPMFIGVYVLTLWLDRKFGD